ncbi:MAG: FAD-dependent oxidoreductase [Hyphomicrobium sp.]
MKHLVLIGGGHVHLFVLEALIREPLPNVSVTLMAREAKAPYSGMLPGYVAGRYAEDDFHVDLRPLAQRAGARFIHASADDIDREQRTVRIAEGGTIPFDVLSLDTGITPDLGGIEGASAHAIAVKPISTFAPKWRQLREAARTKQGPRTFAVVGAGAAGFELVLAMRQGLLSGADGADVQPADVAFTLIGSGVLLETMNMRARSLARRALADRNITLIEHDSVRQIGPNSVMLDSGRIIHADCCVVATGAAPPPWFADTGLARDAHGYLAVQPTLQSLNDADIFASGDCATVIDHPRPKAGVFAVRQGPVLADNLRRRLQGAPTIPFKPQSDFLTLLSLGDGHAIAARGRFAVHGRWVWSWKDWIDRHFVARFR